jgi:hypothetical protein
MKANGYLRKILTYAADALSVVTGSVVCSLMFYPETFLKDSAVSFILVLIISMGLFSIIFKTL